MRHTWPGGREPVQVVPVGHPLGLKFRSDQGAAAELCMVRLGKGLWQIPRLGYELWLKVRVAQDRQSLSPWAQQNDVEDASEALLWLRDAGLLASLTGDVLGDRPTLG